MTSQKRPPISIRFSKSEEDFIRQIAKEKGVTLTELIKSNFRKSFYEENQAS